MRKIPVYFNGKAYALFTACDSERMQYEDSVSSNAIVILKLSHHIVKIVTNYLNSLKYTELCNFHRNCQDSRRFLCCFSHAVKTISPNSILLATQLLKRSLSQSSDSCRTRFLPRVMKLLSHSEYRPDRLLSKYLFSSQNPIINLTSQNIPGLLGNPKVHYSQSSTEPANNRAVPFFQMTGPSVTVICDEKG